jgi:hypothetical protein
VLHARLGLPLMVSHDAVHIRDIGTHVKRIALEPWHADILAADPVGA